MVLCLPILLAGEETIRSDLLDTLSELEAVGVALILHQQAITRAGE